MENALLEIKNLTTTYGEGEGKTYALNNVSLSVKQGEFLAIVGESGSGKTTLLNLVASMDRPESGSILYKGEDIVRFSTRKITDYRRNEVGYVFQFFNFLNDLNVLQNVIIVPGSKKNKDRALSLLSRVGLSDKLDRFPRQLSGGQQQRVAIARALNKEGSLLLCDEPTGALDAKSGVEILKLIEEIHDEGKTIILVTHTREIASMATRVIHMKDGVIDSDIINEHPVKAEDIAW